MSDDNYYDILGYLENETRALDQAPFNEVDALIFAVLSYCRFDGYIPEPDKKAEWVPLGSFIGDTAYAVTKELSSAEKKRLLLVKTAQNPRFSGISANYYVNHTDSVMEKQFSAVTFRLPDRTVFIAFRGTDNTLTGWRENFNMAYLNTVPAQQAASSYLSRVMELCSSRLPWKNVRGCRIGGHSKGGNLSVYAAVNCPEQLRSRLLDIYSFDGPGFKNNIFQMPEYKELRGRVHLLLPQDSMIGTLLIQSTDYEVVKSIAEGFDEHDPFSWRINGRSFVNEEELSPKARKFNDILDRWIGSVDDGKRSLLVKVLFEIIDSTNAKSFGEVLKLIEQRDWSALKVLRNVPAEERRELLGILMALLRSYLDISKEQRETAKK